MITEVRETCHITDGRGWSSAVATGTAFVCALNEKSAMENDWSVVQASPRNHWIVCPLALASVKRLGVFIITTAVMNAMDAVLTMDMYRSAVTLFGTDNGNTTSNELSMSVCRDVSLFPKAADCTMPPKKSPMSIM
mmetsp:Transcript_9014/g.24558  ORF Transcript_9014/g.24558 Transcript_9014/m.24558 type:complete len:136 (+) Transcript_9014:734-1141(+)